jgi:hypothetical protein
LKKFIRRISRALQTEQKLKTELQSKNLEFEELFIKCFETFKQEEESESLCILYEPLNEKI